MLKGNGADYYGRQERAEKFDQYFQGLKQPNPWYLPGAGGAENPDQGPRGTADLQGALGEAKAKRDAVPKNTRHRLGAPTSNGPAKPLTQAELNKMDGCTATTTELNYTDGVTSNIQTQLNAKAASARTISAGGGLSGGGNLTANRTISHSDTSAQGSVNNSGNTVIQDISVDTYGHVTSIGSKALSIPAAYTQPTATGAVGTYALLKQTVTSTVQAPGATRAGSGLDYSSCSGVGVTTSPAGTWRIMGAMPSATAFASNTSVWLRIS